MCYANYAKQQVLDFQNYFNLDGINAIMQLVEKNMGTGKYQQLMDLDDKWVMGQLEQ